MEKQMSILKRQLQTERIQRNKLEKQLRGQTRAIHRYRQVCRKNETYPPGEILPQCYINMICSLFIKSVNVPATFLATGLLKVFSSVPYLNQTHMWIWIFSFKLFFASDGLLSCTKKLWNLIQGMDKNNGTTEIHIGQHTLSWWILSNEKIHWLQIKKNF